MSLSQPFSECPRPIGVRAVAAITTSRPAVRSGSRRAAIAPPLRDLRRPTIANERSLAKQATDRAAGALGRVAVAQQHEVVVQNEDHAVQVRRELLRIGVPRKVA